MTSLRLYTLPLTLLVASLLLTGCGAAATTTPPAADPLLTQDFTPIVSATGKVVPAQFATLSLQTAGVVVELAAIEGTQVAEGETLLTLGGGEQLQAAVSAAQLELLAAEQALTVLDDNAELAAAQAQATLASARRAVEDAQRRLTNTSGPAKQTDIDQAYASVVLAQDRLERAHDNFEPYANRPEDNITRANLLAALAQAQDIYDAAVRRWNNLRGSGTELDLAQAQADLAVAQAQLALAEQDAALRQNGPHPDELALARARLELAENQLAAAQLALDNLSLKAPFAGTVSQVYVRPGEWASPGQPILLLGALNSLWVETTDLNEIDAARIRVGDSATVSFDALPELVLNGRVLRISSKAAPGTGVNYTVIIQLDEVPANLLWDMTAFVDIEIDD